MLCPDSPAALNSVRFRSRSESGLTRSQISECKTFSSSHSPPVSLSTDVSQVTVIDSPIQIPLPQ